MKRRTMSGLRILLLLALALAAQQAGAQGDSAKAAAVLARHIEAMGGEAALRSITHYHAVMTASMTSAAGERLDTRQEVFVRAPNLVYMKMEMAPMNEVEVGFDGKVAWSNSKATGPIVFDDPPKNITSMATITALPLAGARLSYVGRREIGGVSFDAVRAELPHSQVGIYYFDLKSGLLSGMDPESGPPAPSGRMTLTFDDYKRFGRVLQSTRLTTVVMGLEMVARTISVSHDPIDSKVFDPPPAVRQLLDKQPRR